MRLVFLAFSSDASWPHSIYFEGDAPLFADWSAALDRGEPFEAGLPLHSPVTAYVMHWLGPPASRGSDGAPPPRDFRRVKTVWCIISATTSALLYLVARPMGRRVALLAALLHAFSFGTTVIASSLNNECLYAFLLVAIVGLTVRWISSPTLRLALLIGAVHGVAALTRAEHPLFAVACAAVMVLRPGGKRIGRKALGVLTMGVGAAAVCLPWSLKSRAAIVEFNQRETSRATTPAEGIEWTDDARALFDSIPAFARADCRRFARDWFLRRGQGQASADDVRRLLLSEFGYVPRPISPNVLVSCQGPLAFALANHPASDGGFSKAALDARFQPDPPLQLSLPSHLRLVNDGYRVGWETIRADPGGWATLVGRKLERFARGVTLGFTTANWPLGREGLRPAVDLLAVPISAKPAWSVAVAAVLVAGVIVAIRRRIAGLWLLAIACKLVVTVVFFGYARQAVSIAPAFLVLAALALDALCAPMSRKSWMRLCGWIALAAVTLLATSVEIRAAIEPAQVHIRGPAHAAPRWARNAFEAPETIEIRVTPRATE